MWAISAKSVGVAPYLEDGGNGQTMVRTMSNTDRADSLLHVLPPCITEHLSCPWCICSSPRNLHHLPSRSTWIGPVLVEALKGSWKHLLESNDHDTIRHTMANHSPCQMQTRRAGAAVIVDIIDWDLGHPKLVEDTLTTGRIAIAVACDTLLNIVVIDLGVKERFDASFETEFSVVDCEDDSTS